MVAIHENPPVAIQKHARSYFDGIYDEERRQEMKEESLREGYSIRAVLLRFMDAVKREINAGAMK